MDGFLVRPDQLEPLCDLLGEYAEDAVDVSEFITKEAGMGVHDQGLLLWLTRGHEYVLVSTQTRVAAMYKVGYGARSAVRETLDHYGTVDVETAGDLDELYGDGERAFPPPDSVGYDTGFAEEADASALLKPDGDVAGLEPKADLIEQAVRDFANSISPAHWIRVWIAEVLAEWGAEVTDPIGWVIEWFTGDWKGWARCALAWEACSAAVTQMSRNVANIPASSDGVWEGNAADHAMRYFHQLKSATETEALAFEGLQGRYELLLEVCHSYFQLANDCTNMIIDLVVSFVGTAVSTAMTGVSLEELAYIGTTLVGLVSDIVTVVTTVLNVVTVFCDAVAVGDLPEVPPCELGALRVFDVPGRN